MFSTKHKGIKQHYKIASKCWKRITLIKLKSYCKAYLEVNVIKQQHDEKNNTVKVKHYRNNSIIKLSINYSQNKKIDLTTIRWKCDIERYWAT